MTAALTRVDSLIARALDAGASEEERRTSAVIACRMIREHRLLGRTSDDAAATRGKLCEWWHHGYERGLADGRAEIVIEAVAARRIIGAKYAGRCSACGQRWRVGDSIAWAKGEAAICMSCWRRAA
jgi:hypothetical protein